PRGHRRPLHPCPLQGGHQPHHRRPPRRAPRLHGPHHLRSLPRRRPRLPVPRRQGRRRVARRIHRCRDPRPRLVHLPWHPARRPLHRRQRIQPERRRRLHPPARPRPRRQPRSLRPPPPPLHRPQPRRGHRTGQRHPVRPRRQHLHP